VPVQSLAGFFRQIWASGAAGAEVTVTVHRDGRAHDVHVKSADRADFLKAPKLQ
jgi:hypothetical protein